MTSTVEHQAPDATANAIYYFHPAKLECTTKTKLRVDFIFVFNLDGFVCVCIVLRAHSAQCTVQYIQGETGPKRDFISTFRVVFGMVVTVNAYNMRCTDTIIMS